MATPKDNTLEPTLAQFEAYDGGILHSHGWIILPTRDIRDNKKFHPVRYCGDKEARILISHATATWLGLGEGPMSKQGAQDQKASSICF